jgi:hypothetical protein
VDLSHRADHVQASLRPERRIIILLGTGFTDGFQPDFRSDRLCYGGKDMLYILSGSSCVHTASVRLEGWTGEPERLDYPWEERAETEMELTRGEMYVSGMAEFPVSRSISVGSPGACRVRVHALGRQLIDHLDRVVRPDPEDIPADIVKFLIQVWPR